MVEAGLTPAQVLVPPPAGARASWGASDIGTLAPGKLADLLVLDGDPTADLGVLESPRQVIKGGRMLTRDELQGRPGVPAP